MNRTSLGRALVVVGVVGALATAGGSVVGYRLLGTLDRSLEDSLVVTADALTALDGTVSVTLDVLRRASTTLEDTARTAVALQDAMDATATTLRGAADVTERDVAGSLEAIERTLPALIDVAEVIDATLSALDALPIGPDYDPDVAFDDALRDVRDELDGLPEALRDEGELLRDGAERLDGVADATNVVTTDLRLLAEGLSVAVEELEALQVTTAAASEVVGGGADGLAGGLGAARALTVVAGLALVLGQAVPVLAGLALLDPTRLRTLLDEPHP